MSMLPWFSSDEVLFGSSTLLWISIRASPAMCSDLGSSKDNVSLQVAFTFRAFDFDCAFFLALFFVLLLEFWALVLYVTFVLCFFFLSNLIAYFLSKLLEFKIFFIFLTKYTSWFPSIDKSQSDSFCTARAVLWFDVPFSSRHAIHNWCNSIVEKNSSRVHTSRFFEM